MLNFQINRFSDGGSMRDVNRIRPLMERLIAVWERHPDLRLGQIVSNASPSRDSFNIEDEALIRAIERQLRDHPTNKSGDGAA
jgi:hypothetical protein